MNTGARAATKRHRQHVGAGLLQQRRLREFDGGNGWNTSSFTDAGDGSGTRPRPGGRLVRYILVRRLGQQHSDSGIESLSTYDGGRSLQRRGRLRHDTTHYETTNWADVTHTDQGTDLRTIDGRGERLVRRGDERRFDRHHHHRQRLRVVHRRSALLRPLCRWVHLNWDNDPSDPEDEANTTHTDLGTVTLSTGLQGSDTFAMQATDPSTGDTSWDNGAEVYLQGQSVSATFDDNAWGDSSPCDPSDSCSGATHNSGGTDTLSSGDQIGAQLRMELDRPDDGGHRHQRRDGELRTEQRLRRHVHQPVDCRDDGQHFQSHDDDAHRHRLRRRQLHRPGSGTSLTTTTDPDTGDLMPRHGNDDFTETDGRPRVSPIRLGHDHPQ